MVHTFMSNTYESNCYVIADDREGVMIDAEISPLHHIGKIAKINIEIKLLINTHCHYDHVAGNHMMVEKTNARVGLRKLPLPIGRGFP